MVSSGFEAPHIYTHVFMYMHMYTHTKTYMCTCRLKNTCIYTDTDARTHVHTHMHAYAPFLFPTKPMLTALRTLTLRNGSPTMNLTPAASFRTQGGGPHELSFSLLDFSPEIPLFGLVGAPPPSSWNSWSRCEI